MENQEDWLVLLCSNGILDVLLVLAEELWVKLDVSWLVDTVDVTKTSSDGEVWGDWRKSLVDGKDIFRLSVERVIVDVLVVDTILFATSDTNLLYGLLKSCAERSIICYVPSRATASLVRRASGTLRWFECCSQPLPH